MSIRVGRPYGIPDIDLFGRKSIKVDRCPICGSACLPGSRAIERLSGFDVRDGHCYSCQNLKVTFCDDCLIGEGGVDIICRVVEANEVQRKMVANDAYSILKVKHDELVSKIKKWAIGIAIALGIIGICCLIWTPGDVFAVIGVIGMFILFGLLQCAARRR